MLGRGSAWWAVAAFLCASMALAQTRPVAVLREVKPSSSPELERSLREMLSRLDVNLDTAVADGGAVALALIDVDLSSGTIVVDSPSRVVTIRRELSAGASTDVLTETAATLIASSVDVLLHTDPPRQPFKLEAPAVLEPPPPPPKLSRVGLDLGVGLGPRLLGGPAVVDVGASVHALLTVPIGSQLPGLLTSLTFQPGFDLDTEAVSLRGSAILARAFLQLELFRWKYGRLEAGAGGGFDRFAFTPLAREGEVFRPMANRVAVAPIVSGLIAYRLPVGESVHLFASLQVDGDLRGPPPMRGPAQQDPTDLRPWTVRPMLLLGVSFAPLRARQ